MLFASGAFAGGDAAAEASQRVQADAVAALAGLPAVDIAKLPVSQQQGIARAQEALRSKLDGPARELGTGEAKTTVFRLANGTVCFADAGGGGCSPASKVNPHISLGYDQAAKTTKVKVVVPGPGISDLAFTDAAGKSVPVELSSGVGEIQASGAGGKLTWKNYGEPAEFNVAPASIDSSLSDK